MMGLDRGLVSREEAYRVRLKEMADHFGFHLDPGTAVERLTVGERQQLELVRLLALGVEVLILDEPTTGISSLQKQALFSALRKLASEGKTILLVSHKLEDVEALCDRITVLRRGKVQGDMACRLRAENSWCGCSETNSLRLPVSRDGPGRTAGSAMEGYLPWGKSRA